MSELLSDIKLRLESGKTIAFRPSPRDIQSLLMLHEREQHLTDLGELLRHALEQVRRSYDTATNKGAQLHRLEDSNGRLEEMLTIALNKIGAIEQQTASMGVEIKFLREENADLRKRLSRLEDKILNG